MTARPDTDWELVAETAGGFIAGECRRRRRDGAALGLSGGLDSSTVAALCVRGLGADRVTGLMMPEREGDPQDVADARLVGERLGMRTTVRDISPQLRAMGVYRYPLSRVPTRTLRDALARLARWMLFERRGARGGAGAAGGAVVSRSMAHAQVKHRMRMVALYHYAEEHNLLVVGCANRTEKLTGLFTRYGVDQCADVMPIGGLYRSQVMHLARRLGIPEAVMRKPPNPGIVAGLRDKYLELLGASGNAVDAVLLGLGAGRPATEVAAEAGVEPAIMERIAEMVRRAEPMQGMALEPDLGHVTGRAPCER